MGDNGEKWSEPVVTGKGAAMTTIDSPRKPSPALVRITLTGSDKGCFWSFYEPADIGAAEDKPE